MPLPIPLEAAHPIKPRRWRRLALRLTAIVFVISNVAAFLIAWAATHYEAPGETHNRARPGSPWQKFESYATHLAMPRPQGATNPSRWNLPYTTVHYPGAEHLNLEAWRIAGKEGSPTVLLFHGHGAGKTSTLGAAKEFHEVGCETWMVDFHGSGGSAGSTTTIGYSEADDVLATVREALAAHPQKQPMILYGTSMGAAAILCAIHRYHLQPDALILECPYDRLVTTIGNRCRPLGLPAFPSAELVVFWGGVQRGFNGFSLNPVDYARDVHCPTLLLQGDCDRCVGLDHAREIANALGKQCTFDIFPGIGHTIPVREQWHRDVTAFLETNGLIPKG